MPFVTRFAQRFHQLRWKLTFSYLITTLLALIVLGLAGGLLLLFGLLFSPAAGFAFQVGTVAQNVSANFLGPFANRAALSDALDGWYHDSGTEFEGTIFVVDPTGMVLASAGDRPLAPGTYPTPNFPANVQQLLQETFTRDPSTVSNQTTATRQENNTTYLVAPIVSEQHIRGALLVEAHQVQLISPTLWKSAPTIFLYASGSLLFFFVGAGTIGLASGIVTARSLTRRIRRILDSAEKWSQGEFSTFVDDASTDELGQLAQRLNLMAHQLQDLLYTRQVLATLQERNRLARDLHDSVKQEIFALSIWLRNTRALIGRDEEAAKQQLTEAEKVIRQTQMELASLISELRPVALDGKDLAQALRDYVQTWRTQTNIDASIVVNGKQEIAPAIEGTFFRIAQEALTNVARHSQASLVTLQLDINAIVSLSIRDNGCGFDTRHISKPGVGLASMRERMDALQGQIEIQSQKGQGTTIIVQCKQLLEHDTPNGEEKG